jgi:hypothetical protein
MLAKIVNAVSLLADLTPGLVLFTAGLMCFATAIAWG